MTLRKGSRSNEWYVRKCIDKCDIRAFTCDAKVSSIGIHVKCELWLIKYCHADLVMGAIGQGHPICLLDTRNEDNIF